VAWLEASTTAEKEKAIITEKKATKIVFMIKPPERYLALLTVYRTGTFLQVGPPGTAENDDVSDGFFLPTELALFFLPFIIELL
jgi:MoxR-like ATPase